MYVIQHYIIITSAKTPCCIEIQYQITLKIIDIVHSEGVQSIKIENPIKMINAEWIGKIYRVRQKMYTHFNERKLYIV